MQFISIIYHYNESNQKVLQLKLETGLWKVQTGLLYSTHVCTFVRYDCKIYTDILWDVTVRCTRVYCEMSLWGVNGCTVRYDCEVYTSVPWDEIVRCTQVYCEIWLRCTQTYCEAGLRGVHRCTVKPDCKVYTIVLWNETARCTREYCEMWCTHHLYCVRCDYKAYSNAL